MSRKRHFARWDGHAETLVEGSRAAVVRYLKAAGLWGDYKRHRIRIGYFC